MEVFPIRVKDLVDPGGEEKDGDDGNEEGGEAYEDREEDHDEGSIQWH